jgi:RimJ/RimL family protein N-acetyltransferase
MPSFPELVAPLGDGVVALRLSAERDIPEVLIAYQDDPDLARALEEPRPPSGAELGRRAERAEAERLAGSGLIFTILAAGSDVCVGEVRVQDVHWEQGIAGLAVWTAPRVRGQGMGRRAVLLARDWLWRECALDATP